MSVHVSAILGPTNTGKTHAAVERMLGHRSGMIGLPLRLLAREVYDRVVARVGPTRVALVTGEEKIVPARPQYWIATVEAMPIGTPVEFLAVDEIQLAGDRQRGHVFTDRLLHARGMKETLFLGSDSIAPVLKRLLPDVVIERRSRFSTLRHVPPEQLKRLPRRSAVVAFSAEEVYALAEMLRRRRGGAAVVLGALSPRTRNAQAQLFESGEVDFLVATDAIGMGLNMNIAHVAFASLHKFDGERERPLLASEIGQIAGRAGRYMDDGTFSTLADTTPPIPPSLVSRVENHRFIRLKRLVWRNSDLDFRSPVRLMRALQEPPPRPELVRVRDALDETCLRLLIGDPDVQATLTGPERLHLLWEVCGLPDYRQTTPGRHAALVKRLYLSLAERGRIAEDWIARSIQRIDNVAGDIDTLAERIARIRIWTYLTHRADWVEDAGGWAERARAVEDRLSDALHRVLSDRFVDRRSSVLMRQLREKAEVPVAIDDDGLVTVDGTAIARIEGLRLRPLPAAGDPDRRLREKLAQKAIRTEISRRFRAFMALGEEALELVLPEDEGNARILWRGAILASVDRGQDPLRPAVRLAPDLALPAEQARLLNRRLETWLHARLEHRLGPLFALRTLRTNAAGHAEPQTQHTDGKTVGLSAAGRAVAFRLEEGLGVISRDAVRAELAALSARDRRLLRQAGVRLGAISVFLPPLLKPDAMRLKALLWAVARGGHGPLLLPAPGEVTTAIPDGADEDLYRRLGYLPIAPGRAVRVDMLERLAHRVRPYGQNGAWFFVEGEDLSLVGCRRDEIVSVMRVLGYGHRRIARPAQEGEGTPATGGKDEGAHHAPGERPAEAERVVFFWQGHRQRPPRRAGKGRSRRRPPAPSAADRQAGKRKADSPSRNRSKGRSGRTEPAAPRHSPFAVLIDLKKELARRGREKTETASDPSQPRKRKEQRR